MTGVVVLLAVLVLAAGFGLWRRRTDGRLRPVPARQPHGPAGPDRASDGAEPDVLGAADLGGPLGERATLVQFSTAFCAPCRGTRVVLGEVAGMLPGVRHVDIDAEAHLDLVRRLDVQRTPTVFVLDGAGQVRSRAAGAPRKADVIAALGEFL